MADLQLQLQNYRLTTARIIYHMPDHPSLLQTFLWQHYDLAPQFPELKRFLKFWEREIEGRIHAVEVANRALITPADIGFYDLEMTLH